MQRQWPQSEDSRAQSQPRLSVRSGVVRGRPESALRRGRSPGALGRLRVTAAGNGGYGIVNTYSETGERATHMGTIADPGNANLAITVGSTHRDMPHSYGVSYFSARGPTSDGRMKPDLVAPGERI